MTCRSDRLHEQNPQLSKNHSFESSVCRSYQDQRRNRSESQLDRTPYISCFPWVILWIISGSNFLMSGGSMGGISSYRVISNRQLIYCKWGADRCLRTHAFGSAPIINQKCRMIQTPGVNRIRLTFNYRSRNKSALVWFNCPSQIASGAACLWLCTLTRHCAIIKSQRGGRRNQFSVNTGCSFAGYNCYWVVISLMALH